jgi:hypothetical protein
LGLPFYFYWKRRLPREKAPLGLDNSISKA